MNPKDGRNNDIVYLYLTGRYTYEALGIMFGVTRERVRQILGENGIEPKILLAERKQQREDERKFIEFAQAASDARVCIVCEFWVLRRTGRTICSLKCSRIFKQNKHRLDFERFVVIQAKSILRHANARPVSAVAWAENTLARQAAGLPLSPNRQFSIPGSMASESLKEVR